MVLGWEVRQCVEILLYYMIYYIKALHLLVHRYQQIDYRETYRGSTRRINSFVHFSFFYISFHHLPLSSLPIVCFAKSTSIRIFLRNSVRIAAFFRDCFLYVRHTKRSCKLIRDIPRRSYIYIHINYYVKLGLVARSRETLR